MTNEIKIRASGGFSLRERFEKWNSQALGDKIFDIFVYFILLAVTFMVVYPLYFICIASISDPMAVNAGNVTWRPVGPNVLGYEKIFEDRLIWSSYFNTILYTVAGTLINIILTMLLAYPMSRRNFGGRKFLTFFVMFTMYFQGGMIPTFLWMNRLHLYNTRFVILLLPAINVFNLLIAINYIKNNIPEELYEAASIDGCGHAQYFVKVIFPLSQTIITVLILYYGVAHWNEFMNGLIYLRSESKYPLQLVLRGILLQNQVSGADDVETLVEQQKAAELIKYGCIIVSTLPVIVIYPFMQKYFAKGIMVGSVKG